MDIEKLIDRLRDAGWTNPGLTDKQSLEWDAADALEQLQAENAQLRRRLSEAVSACSRIQEWAQNTGHDYVEGIAREFLEEENRHDT